MHTSTMTACAFAHNNVTSLVVDDDSDADFGSLGFCHCLFLVDAAGVRDEKRYVK